MPCREGNGVMIDAVAGTDERPRAAKAGSSTDALAMSNTLICGLSAAACLAVLAAGLCTGKRLTLLPVIVTILLIPPKRHIHSE